MNRPVDARDRAVLAAVSVADQPERVLNMLEPVALETRIEIASVQDGLARIGAALGGDIDAVEGIVRGTGARQEAILEPAAGDVGVAPLAGTRHPFPLPA